MPLLDARRGKQPDASGAQLASELEAALWVRLHRRMVEKALGVGRERAAVARLRTAQTDYEQLRAVVLAGGELGELLTARRFEVVAWLG